MLRLQTPQLQQQTSFPPLLHFRLTTIIKACLPFCNIQVGPNAIAADGFNTKRTSKQKIKFTFPLKMLEWQSLVLQDCAVHLCNSTNLWQSQVCLWVGEEVSGKAKKEEEQSSEVGGKKCLPFYRSCNRYCSSHKGIDQEGEVLRCVLRLCR